MRMQSVLGHSLEHMLLRRRGACRTGRNRPPYVYLSSSPSDGGRCVRSRLTPRHIVGSRLSARTFMIIPRLSQYLTEAPTQRNKWRSMFGPLGLAARRCRWLNRSSRASGDWAAGRHFRRNARTNERTPSVRSLPTRHDRAAQARRWWHNMLPRGRNISLGCLKQIILRVKWMRAVLFGNGELFGHSVHCVGALPPYGLRARRPYRRLHHISINAKQPVN